MGSWNGISFEIKKKHIRIGNKFDCVEVVMYSLLINYLINPLINELIN